MKGMRLKTLCLVMLLVSATLLSGCLARGKNDAPRAYYLRVGEPAPIEGFLISKEDMSDLLVSAIKRERGE